MDVDTELVASALNFDAAYCCIGELHREILTDLPVLGEVMTVFLLAKPTTLPVGGDSQTESVRIDFLAHQFSSPDSLVLSVDSSEACASGFAARARLAATRAERLTTLVPPFASARC